MNFLYFGDYVSTCLIIMPAEVAWVIGRLIWNGMGPMSVVHACKFKQLRGEGNKDQELKASLGYTAT